MNATTPPRAWASARTCWQTVVLPDDSGPKISVIRPRGMPPTPSARSSAIEPVGIVSSDQLLARPELHDRAAAELLLDRGQGGVDRLASLGGVAFRRSFVRHRHLSVTLLIRSMWDRSPERTRWRPPVDQPSSARRPRRPWRSLRGLRITSTFCGGSDSGDRLGWVVFCLRLLLGSLLGSISRAHRFASASSMQTTDRSFTPTSRRLHRHLPGPREGAVRRSKRGRFRPGSRLGSWP